MNREQLIRYATAVVLLGACLSGAAQTQQSKPAQKDQQGAKQQQSTATPANNHKPSEGERIFTQNCARCHNPPDGFSSRISGTVTMHMRVRAGLSEHDMQELQRFFNP
jgi:mono/diheme cytochrome c family protein